MDDFWSLGISCYGKEEIWFMEVSANGHSILEQLGHKPRTSYMRRKKNEFVSQRPNIFSINAYHAQQHPEVPGRAQI